MQYLNLSILSFPSGLYAMHSTQEDTMQHIATTINKAIEALPEVMHEAREIDVENRVNVVSEVDIAVLRHSDSR